MREDMMVDLSKLPPPMAIDPEYVQPPRRSGFPHFEADIYAIEGQVKLGTVNGFNVRCDERPDSGSGLGTGSAPTPLAYFTLGVGFCLATHVIEVARAMKIEASNVRVRVTSDFSTEGSTLRGDRKAFVNGFAMEVSMDTDAAPELVSELVRRAEDECYASAALRTPIDVEITTRVNGEAAIAAG
jgi:uncharacterized OsmC-like protein